MTLVDQIISKTIAYRKANGYTKVLHVHSFEDQGGHTETGEAVLNCASDDCYAYQDAEGNIIN